MKKIAKILVVSSIFVACLCGGTFSACSDGQKPTVDNSTEYLWQYNKPFSPIPDAYMTMDGKLDEEVWEDQNYFEYGCDEYSFRVTAVMTSTGIYIGAEAVDDFVYWEQRNSTVPSTQARLNTYFYFQMVRENEVGTQGYYNKHDRLTRMATFYIDPLNCVSYRQTPFLSAAYIDSADGTYNKPDHSVDTKGWSVEIFVSWEDLNIEEWEKNDEGYMPMKMICGYSKEHKDRNLVRSYYIPFNMQEARYDTYYSLDKTGFKGLGFGADSPFGHAKNGVAATDKWTVNKEEKSVSTAVNQTQYIFWANEEPANDYVMEATLTCGELTNVTTELISSGLVTFKQSGAYKIFASHMTNLTAKKSLLLSVTHLTDGLQYLDYSTATRYEDVYKEGGYDASAYDGLNLADGQIRLKLIKRGEFFFFFYNDVLWEIEQANGWSGKTHTGFFTNGAVTFSDVKYQSYQGKTAELDALIDTLTYRVQVPGTVAGGTFSTDYTYVGKGKSATFSIRPELGYYLSDAVEVDAQGTRKDLIEEIRGGMQGTEYVYTPNRNVTIEAEFTAFTNLVETPIEIFGINDANEEIRFPGLEYTIQDAEGKLFYRGETNPSSVIVGALPKEGNYAGFGSLSGQYILTFEPDGYFEKKYTFTAEEINNAYQRGELTRISTKILPYGNVTVNTLTAYSNGNVLYDKTSDTFYSENGGWLRKYFKDSVSDTMIVNAKVKTTGFESSLLKGNVAGVVFTPGNDDYSIKFKRAPWEPNNLIIDFGSDFSGITNLSLSGFPADVINDGEHVATINVVLLNRKLYVYNNVGELGLVVDKDGLHAIGDRTFSDLEKVQQINEKCKGLFAGQYKNLAMGMTNVSSGGAVYFDFDYTVGAEAQAEAQSKVSANLFTANYTLAGYNATIEGLNVDGKYFVGAPITLTLKPTGNTNSALVIRLTDANGTEEVNGVYNSTTKETSFTFNGRVLSSITVIEEYISITATGSISGVNAVGTVFMENATYGISYSGTLNADGTFEIKDVAQGTYDFEFISGDKVAYILNRELTESDNDVEATMQDGLYRVSSTLQLNGTTYQGKTPSSIATRAPFATGNTIPFSAETNNVALPNTVVNGDASYTFNVDYVGSFAQGACTETEHYTPWMYREHGIGITNGEYTLSFGLKYNYAHGKTEVYLRFLSADGTVVRDTVNVGSTGITDWYGTCQDESSLTITKMGDTITVYCKGQLLVTMTKNGIVGAYEGNEDVKDFVVSLFDASKQHAMVHTSDSFHDESNLQLTVTYGKVSTSIVNVTGATSGKVIAQNGGFISEATVTNGKAEITLLEGTYDFEVVSTDGKVGYVLGQTIGANKASINVTVSDNTYAVASSLTLNGSTYQESTSTVAQRALYAKANIAECKPAVSNVALVNTVANGNSAYTFNIDMNGNFAKGGTREGDNNVVWFDYMNREHGIGITTGEYTLIVAFKLNVNTYTDQSLQVTLKKNGVTVVTERVAVTDLGIHDWSQDSESNLKIVKTADTITISCKDQTVLTINANGITGAFANNADATAMATSLFTAEKEHALIYGSNYWPGYSMVNVTPTYTKN